MVTIIMRFNQSANHRPILVTLRFLGTDQVGQAEDIDLSAGHLHCQAPAPELIERRHAAHHRHDIDTHPPGVGMSATEMNRESAPEIIFVERRNGNHLGLQILEGLL